MTVTDDDDSDAATGRASSERRAVNGIVGQNIVLHREAAGMSVEDLAELCSVSAGMLRFYEAGRLRVPPATLVRIAEALCVSTLWFFRDLDS